MRHLYSLRSFFLVTGALMLCVPFSLMGQQREGLRPVSRTYAITRVTIIPSPGKKIDKGTVVIKDGVIAAVGKSVAVPPDAILLPMDSMYVYAGFIDGFSYAGVKSADGVKEKKAKGSGKPKPDADRAGITPQRDVRDFLDPKDITIANFREQGFAVAQVAPHGGMLPGKSAIVLLGGITVDDMLLEDRVALCSELIAFGQVYPSTVMGTMATWRDLYRQAGYVQAYERVYRSDPAGRTRPRSDETLQAFYPVLDKTQPVLFKAEKVLDIQRAISLRDELGFRLMIASLREGWPIAEKIKKADVDVFLSLNLPEALKKKKAKDSTETNAEKKALRERAQQAVANYTGQAALFSKKGIPFGFSTGGVNIKDIRPNMRRMIKEGMSEETMLEALTTTPARLLGLDDRLGTVQVGKMANLIISDKPYFEEKARVKHMFVDGVKYDVAKKKKKSDTEPVAVTGSWSYTADTPEEKVTGVLVISSDDNVNYSATITNSYTGEEVEVEDFLLEDNALSFAFTINVDDESVRITADLSLEQDTFNGTFSTGDELLPVEGTKKPELTL